MLQGDGVMATEEQSKMNVRIWEANSNKFDPERWRKTDFFRSDWNSELSISQKLAISASDEDPLIREYFLHFAYENYTEIYLPLHLHRLWSSLCDQNSDIKIAILGKKCLWHQMLPPKHSNYSTEKKFILRWVPLIFTMENPVSYITIYNTDY